MTFTNQIAIAIFYPLAVGAVFTFLSAWLSGRNATKNAHVQNDLAAKMKLADFRQGWINQLRDCLAEFQSCAATYSHMEGLLKLQQIAAKIRLLINKNDKNYERLSSLLDVLSTGASPKDRSKLLCELTPLSQEILKTEWEVLKQDLSYRKSAL